MIKVLCIDDSKAIHAFLKQCLVDESIEFSSAFDGVQGVDRVKTGEIFDLIFLDWEMPNKTGPEVLDDFKIMNLKTPVIMLTSKNEAGDIAQMLTKGASEYVLKPFTKDILLEKISFVIGNA